MFHDMVIPFICGFLGSVILFIIFTDSIDEIERNKK
jgi:hypothetical protein